MLTSHPVLVTGAAGQVGGIGRLLVETLRDRASPCAPSCEVTTHALLRCGCAGRRSRSPISRGRSRWCRRSTAAHAAISV